MCSRSLCLLSMFLCATRPHASSMRDEELAGRVSMPNKDVTKIVVKLLEDQIISVYVVWICYEAPPLNL